MQAKDICKDLNKSFLVLQIIHSFVPDSVNLYLMILRS